MTTLAANAVTVEGQLAKVRFDRFDQSTYDLFLKAKRLPESNIAYDWQTDTYTLTTSARFASMLGVAVSTGPSGRVAPAGHLFDYQGFIVNRALEAHRYAAWCDTGLGKSHIFIEWARQLAEGEAGRVLILSPLQIIGQTRRLAEEWFGLDIERVANADLADWCQRPGSGIGIASHHALVQGVMPELRHLLGVVVDESSVLKTGGGVIKWNLIKSARGIPYKLSCTATPAPNDTMEYASQASFLEKLRTEGDILWTYFTKDGKNGQWYIKPHAREAFYAFMASWSIYMRDPAAFGFEDILATLPPADFHEYTVDITPAQRELMYALLTEKGKGLIPDGRLGVQDRMRLSEMAKGFLYDTSSGQRSAVHIESRKPEFVADLVRQDVADGRQCLVWTVFDEESALVAHALERHVPPRWKGNHNGYAVLDGSMSDTAREEVIERFKAGDYNVLITKAQLAGYGLNLQNVRSMVFSGFDDSFERMYQAVRRAYRYGQTETVRVHVPYIPELEGLMLGNVRDKETRFLKDVAEQERWYQQMLGKVAA